MARKKRRSKTRSKGRRERRSYYSDSKRPREALSVPSRKIDRVLSFSDRWRARKRELYVHAHPLRKVRGLAGYGFRRSWKYHREREKLRRKRDDQRYRNEYGITVDSKRLVQDRDKRVCKRRVGRRIALFALGKAGAGKSIRGIKRWTRDSYVDCR